ncbi:SDR family NAD(P)-dependent oxidoreductase [Aestuariibacter sp. A3R04]|uniref:SDR family NAD(P)-dependent oxidoreductase n=1 Tax=Aestuariibacter sp. A3R04 TaxID=2841571 RepID=UPI001C0A09E4|nr:SDR family NAD(P)-dependent oxidoreductase [Aestuariibacter sp. A3R04]MBU3021979.1 SDR family NAD(P)-dependent oxidoreductase [Aestuariibacter sp. A3R04]
MSEVKAAHLVIGAGGAIGKAVVEKLLEDTPETVIYAVSRKHIDSQRETGVVYVELDTTDEQAVTDWVGERKKQGVLFHKVICTIGMLHGDGACHSLFPEKKVEDITGQGLLNYFAVNAVLPALWLKALITAMAPSRGVICCLSARVGSISDNQLGGWYGYRASKAALNMLLKTAAVEYARRSKNTVLVSYHPGTVESNLSAPFQKNVPEGKLFSPVYTASQLLAFINNVHRSEGNIHFVDWAHNTIPW